MGSNFIRKKFSNLILTTNVNKREASPIRDLKLYFI